MPKYKLELVYKYRTALQARERLGFSRFQFDYRIKRGILPEPTFTDTTGVRYFDEAWILAAGDIVEMERDLLRRAQEKKGERQ